MNKFNVYIYVGGAMFNSRSFVASLPKDIAGSVHPIYRMVNGSKTVIGEYWKSRMLHPTADKVEAELIALIREYREAISRAKMHGAERIYAEIVCYMEDLEALHGYFVSKELVALLFELGMELDIDVVPGNLSKAPRRQ